jgi:hypothetical protein
MHLSAGESHAALTRYLLRVGIEERDRGFRDGARIAFVIVGGRHRSGGITGNGKPAACRFW